MPSLTSVLGNVARERRVSSFPRFSLSFLKLKMNLVRLSKPHLAAPLSKMLLHNCIDVNLNITYIQNVSRQNNRDVWRAPNMTLLVHVYDCRNLLPSWTPTSYQTTCYFAILTTVSQKGYVNVIGQGHKPQRVSK